MCGLVATWQAENDWESTLRTQIDPEDDFPEELFGRPAGGTTSLEHNIVASLDSSNGGTTSLGHNIVASSGGLVGVCFFIGCPNAVWRRGGHILGTVLAMAHAIAQQDS